MSYGRNFFFRVPPISQNRQGRWATPALGSDGAGAEFVIGAPVKAAGTTNSGLQLPEVAKADAATPPVTGKHGILVYEHILLTGVDPYLNTYSDKDTAPNGKAVQVISGKEVKVVLRNTTARTFLNTRSYAGRIMVAGVSIATPTVAVGDLLEPATTPNDTNGYWQETATAANAWLVVTGVDTTRGEVEARFLF